MKKIVAIMMAMLMVMSVTVVLASGVATTKEKQSEKVPVIIMFKDKTDKDLIKQHGGEIKSVYQIKPAVAASLPQKAIYALKKNPKIAFIVPDLEIFTMAETLDWGVDRIDADIVHEYNRGTGVKVAIMDTGIDYDHLDLAANYKGGYDFGGRLVWQGRNDDDPMDKQGHGTHCAGIVAAVKGNDIGVVGVAPEAYLYAVKVFDDRGNGRYSDVIEGLEWCINNEIQVISMSFGSAYTAGDPGIESWINATYDAGILLVGAAGNEGSGEDTVIYPARYVNVIAVAATNSDDNRAKLVKHRT
jgi:subtilisin family serine protease